MRPILRVRGALPLELRALRLQRRRLGHLDHPANRPGQGRGGAAPSVARRAAAPAAVPRLANLRRGTRPGWRRAVVLWCAVVLRCSVTDGQGSHDMYTQLPSPGDTQQATRLSAAHRAAQNAWGGLKAAMLVRTVAHTQPRLMKCYAW